MFGNYGKMRSKYGTIYDSPVLPMLVRSDLRKAAGCSEKTGSFPPDSSLRTLWTKVVLFLNKQNPSCVFVTINIYNSGLKEKTSQLK
jgi:hypothetical protein